MQRLPYVGQAAHRGVRLELLLGHARRWANGERPDRVGFRVETPGELARGRNVGAEADAVTALLEKALAEISKLPLRCRPLLT